MRSADRVRSGAQRSEDGTGEATTWPRWLAILKIAKVPFWFMWLAPAVFAYMASARGGGVHHVGWFVASGFGICALQSTGCIHNELVDQPEDHVNQPKRAALVAAVGEDTLWRLVFLGYAACFLGLIPIGIIVGPTPVVIMLIGCLAAPLYNWGPRFKRRPGLAEFAIGWAVFCIYLYAWSWNRPVGEVSPVIWVLTYFFAITCLIKDLPDVAGDELVGARGIFSVKQARLRLGLLLFIYLSPYALLVGFVGAGILPLRFLGMLGLAALGLVVMAWGERVSSLDTLIAVYEIAFVYVHVFFLALLVLDTMTVWAIVVAVLLFVGRGLALAWGLAPRFVEPDFSWVRSVTKVARATW